MNWIDVKKELPKFEEMVLLFQEIDGKPFVAFGYLSSITAKGNCFIHLKAKNISSIYGEAFNSPDIIPTKWCKIEVPNKD